MTDQPGGVIWDLDGTLVDTAELHFQAWSALTGQLDRPFSRGEFAATFGQRNPEILAALFGQRFTAQEVAELGDRKEEFYRAAAEKGVDLLPGGRTLLAGLKAAGFQQAIGSSAPRANIDLILRLTQTASFFDALVSEGDTQRGKPDPQVFLIAAHKLGLDPRRCVVIEDAPAGVQAAKAGGMKCIAVSFVGHHSHETLRKAGADRVVPSLEQVSPSTFHELLS
ncbi:MAG: HAD family phosphatase [Planctomycetes bacterium]|nr:HAD family phosphatase [Planctomycetota bacterium]